MNRRVIIVGAGPAGLTAAAELSEAGVDITIIEKDDRYVGGLSRTVQYKGFRFDIGGHRFFSKSAEITQWWRKRLPHDLLEVRRRSRILYKGKFYDYPLRPWNALGNLGLYTSFSCVASYLWRLCLPIRPEETFEAWVSNRFGIRLYEIFFKTYTEKVWGLSCSEISSDWAAQRIKDLSLLKALANAFGVDSERAVAKTLIDSFLYPRLGPGMMWEKVRDDLLHMGVKIHMGRTVHRIDRCDNRVISVRTTTPIGQEERWSADEFIFSMPLRDFVCGIVPNLSDIATAAARRLRYRDFITVALVVSGGSPFPDNWIYIHDPAVKVGRVQNFANWSRDMIPEEDACCLGLEYFCNTDDDLWRRTDPELLELGKAELQKIGLLSGRDVLDGCVIRVEKAYPVYDSEYQSHVLRIREALGGLVNAQMIGRNGMHRYNNQDHSMMTGLLSARRIKGEVWDPWKVNTDAEYLEEERPSRLFPKRCRKSEPA